MTESATDLRQTTYEQLSRYIDILGAPVLALFGLKDDGTCSCPKGASCGANAGKHPQANLCPKGVHSATTDKSRIKAWMANGLTLNWGIATGKPLPGGDYLIVLDCDPRNGSEETLEALEPLPRTPMQATGGGGQHYLFRIDRETPTGKPGEGLDLKGNGGYIVVEPSTHYTGGRYIWDSGLDIDTPIAVAPEWIVDSKKIKPRPIWTGHKAKDSIIGIGFAAAGWLGHEISEGRHTINCPWSHEHTDGRGQGGDASSVLLPPTDESKFGGFKCSHSHCADKTWKDAMAALPVDAAQAARNSFQVADARIVPAGSPRSTLAPTVNGALSPEDLNYVKAGMRFHKREDGTWAIKKDLVNIVEILRRDPRWKGILSYDNFSHQILLNKEPVWDDADKRTGYEPVYPRQWQDEDDVRTKLWMSRYWGMEWDRSPINEAVISVSQANGVHPVRSYLRSLEWDGVARLDSWLIDYCGAQDSDYARNIGKWWLISAVARIMQPGCKADHVLILEGAQGIGKSTVFQILAGQWVCDSTLTIGEKDAYQLIKGRWIIELAELDSLNRADASRAKAFFTSPTDTYRPSYGRAVVTVPRQCVFAGTVNHSQFLKDETGSRRFWPILCTFIDTTKLRVDRDQLWAEALRLYNDGHRWWPKGIEEQSQCAEEQAQRESTDEWESVVRRWLEGPDAASEFAQYGHIQIGVIMEKCLRLEPGHWTLTDMSRVGRCMQKLGYKKTHVGKETKNRVWAFIKGDT